MAGWASIIQVEYTICCSAEEAGRIEYLDAGKQGRVWIHVKGARWL